MCPYETGVVYVDKADIIPLVISPYIYLPAVPELSEGTLVEIRVQPLPPKSLLVFHVVTF